MVQRGKKAVTNDECLLQAGEGGSGTDALDLPFLYKLTPND